MTEEEMKQTWCPDARVVVDGDGHAGYNRIGTPGTAVSVPYAAMCLGSRCSAWRWTSPEAMCEAHAGDPKRPFVTLVETATRRQYTIIRELPLHGYCGRAGRPA